MTGRISLISKYTPFFILLALLPCVSVLVFAANTGGAATSPSVLWMAAVSGVASSALAIVVIRRIDRSFDLVREASDKFSRGELSHRIPFPESEVAASLASELNRMASRLAQRIQEIEIQSQQGETILSSMVEGVIATDVTGKVVKSNNAASRLLHATANRMNGRMLVESVRSSELHDSWLRVVHRNIPENLQITLDTDAGDMQLDVKMSPLVKDDGSSNGAVIVLSDITRLRKLEQARKDFVANVSHELKTPLTSIKGFAETLMDGAVRDPAEARRFCEIISVQVDRLQAIIDDLLSLSRIEQEIERGSVKLTHIALRDVLFSAIGHASPRAAAKQIQITADCPDSIEVNAHETLLEQAFLNLLENAIKYSESGKPIKVKAGRHRPWSFHRETHHIGSRRLYHGPKQAGHRKHLFSETAPAQGGITILFKFTNMILILKAHVIVVKASDVHI